MDFIFIAVIGIIFGYILVKRTIKTAITVVVIGVVIYVLLTQRIEGGSPIIDQIRSLL